MNLLTLANSWRWGLLLSGKVRSAAALVLGFALLFSVALNRWKDAPDADCEPGRRQIITVAGGSFPSFSLDRGQLLMAAGYQVRDVLHNKLLYKVPFHKGGGKITFSPDGKTLAASADVLLPADPQHNVRYELHLRNAESGESLALLHSTERMIGDFTFSPNGKLIAGSVTDLRPAFLEYSVRLWDTHTGKEIRRIWCGTEKNDNAMEHLAFHPDSKLLITSASNRLYFWNVQTAKLQHTLLIGGNVDHKGNIESLAISPDGKLLAVADSGGGNANAKEWGQQTSLIRLLELPSGKEVAVLDGHPNPMLWGVAFRRNGRWLASVGGDNTVKIWDVPKRKLLYTLPRDNEARSVAFTPDDRWLAVGEYQQTLLYDLVPEPQ